MIAAAAILVPALSFVGVRALSVASPGEKTKECEGTFSVRVATAPEILGPMRTIAADIAKSKVPVGDNCLRVDVVSERPADMYEKLTSSGGDSDADLWIPDSWQWFRRTGIPADRVLPISPTVAASPLVLATNQANAEKIAGKAQSWETLAPAGKMAMSNPEKSAVALSGLLAIRRSLDIKAPEDEEIEVTQERYRHRIGEMILGLTRNKVQDVQSELDYATKKGFRYGVPTTEQQVLALNRAKGAHVVPILPKSGTVLLDYPLIAVLHDKRKIERVIEAGSALMRYVDTPTGKTALNRAGFRDVRGLKPPPGATTSGELKLLHDVSGTDANDVIRSWAAMSVDTRMLAIVDISGTMDNRASDDGRTRIELARDAAGSALTYLPDSAEFGLWEYSEGLVGSQDHKVMTPTRSLDSEQRKALSQSLDKLPGDVGRNTALYDTVLAGFRTVQGYDSDRTNTMVLLTDGTEDNSSALDLNQLINALKNEQDPARPVSVVLVGLGPDVDLGVLNKIAQAGGGKAYRAKDPSEMESIIIDTILRRNCTNACS
ncbi:substrate-binding domain-containing protein [Flindersiella endophytica]